MTNRKQAALSVLVVAAALAVVALRSGEDVADRADATMEGHDHAAMAAPAERQPVVLSTEDARRIGVTFAEVERRALDVSVQALGTVAYDETRLATVSPKVDGWVEALFVDFTGAPVRRGQPLLAVYSPALVSAQEELVLAARLAREAGAGAPSERARGLLESARRRLAWWDVAPEDIRRIEETGAVTKTLTLQAPASGIVVEKNVVEGDRIVPGTTIFRIADLSRVWIEADVFEKDLGLVREGQTATATFEAFPGTVFPARVTYVYPTVSMESRTGRVRLELPNPQRALKPGMYARIRLDVPAPGLSVVVPRSAVLSTGQRSLAFVEVEGGALVPREVTPGRTSGSLMEILAGLEPGERIVSSAAFLVDAESSLGALTEGMEAPVAAGGPPDPAGGGGAPPTGNGSGGAGHAGH